MIRLRLYYSVEITINYKYDITGWQYRVSQKKRNDGFSVQCELKVLNIFTSIDKASTAEENDT